MKFSVVLNKTLSVSFILFLACSAIFAQDRARVVKTDKKAEQQTRPTTVITSNPQTKKSVLTNEIVVKKKESPKDLIRKTSQVTPTTKKSTTTTTKKDNDNTEVNSFYYSAVTRAMMLRSIQNKIGIRYRLGTQGPYAYDCSGFVWKVFQEAGIPFTRTSARQYWRSFEPVYGDDRFEFGTLVFLNKLGHVGIVADKNGFYHASSSKGITYSKFEGYWGKRIVGYRRIPTSFNLQDSMVEESETEEQE